MPVEFQYDPEANRVITHPTGILTISEVRAYFERVFQDPRVESGFVEVVLFDDVEDFAFRYTEVDEVLGAYRKLMLEKGCAGTVFVARTPLGYGIARMFNSVFTEHADLRVARSDAELHVQISDIESQWPGTRP
jgi:hypothetical protein